MNGFANILKPPGLNSAVAVAQIKRALPKGEKVGHMGTLDPEAAGVLPIGIGFGARLFDYIIEKEKRYICQMTLGTTTDTQDSAGRITSKRNVRASEGDVKRAISSFTGSISQTAPPYSAVVKDGKKLYKIAREGGDTTTPERTAIVNEITLLRSFSENEYLLSVVCGRGTYIRALISDIGEALGCGAYCSFLLRESTGCFTLENAITAEEFMENKALLPLDTPLSHMPTVHIPLTLAKSVKNGIPLPLSRVEAEPCSENEPLRAYLDGKFAGIGCVAGGILRFKALMRPEEIAP